MKYSLWASVENPTKFKRINGWLTAIWFVAAFPICIFLAQSVPFLVFISVYAVVTGHLATWQAARVEERQEQEKQEREEKAKAEQLAHDEEYAARLERKMDDLRRVWEERIASERMREDPLTTEE